MLANFLIPIHRAGWPFIGLGAVLALVFAATPLFWPLLLLSLWCIYFFRDPPRLTPQRDGLFVAPADGLVQSVGPAVPPPELGMPAQELQRVSIFLSVFDVHINRVPCDGVVELVAHHPGKFISAASEKASDENERQAVRLRLGDGRSVAVVQIAGLVARRIVCRLKPGQTVRAGVSYGLIRFGSRTDLYLPEGCVPLVYPGQRMIGGETVVADLRAADRQPRSAMELHPPAD